MREHEVARERRLDGDLRRLAVADLADHDDVGVGTHHRAQAGGERQARLVVDLDLGDAVELVLDRVLDRDDVLLDRVELVERAVERGRLAGAGRAGDEHGAVGLRERLREALERLREHAELLELDHDLALVQDSHDDVLAVRARERGDAEVDRPCRRPRVEMRPSCGMRRSAMSRSERILMREIDGRDRAEPGPWRPPGARRRCGSGPASPLPAARSGCRRRRARRPP